MAGTREDFDESPAPVPVPPAMIGSAIRGKGFSVLSGFVPREIGTIRHGKNT